MIYFHLSSSIEKSSLQLVISLHLQVALHATFMEISHFDYCPSYILSWFSSHSFLNFRFSDIFKTFLWFVFIVTILIILVILFYNTMNKRLQVHQITTYSLTKSSLESM